MRTHHTFFFLHHRSLHSPALLMSIDSSSFFQSLPFLFYIFQHNLGISSSPPSHTITSTIYTLFPLAPYSFSSLYLFVFPVPFQMDHPRTSCNLIYAHLVTQHLLTVPAPSPYTRFPISPAAPRFLAMAAFGFSP